MHKFQDTGSVADAKPVWRALKACTAEKIAALRESVATTARYRTQRIHISWARENKKKNNFLFNIHMAKLYLGHLIEYEFMGYKIWNQFQVGTLVQSNNSIIIYISLSSICWQNRILSTHVGIMLYSLWRTAEFTEYTIHCIIINSNILKLTQLKWDPTVKFIRTQSRHLNLFLFLCAIAVKRHAIFDCMISG